MILSGLSALFVGLWTLICTIFIAIEARQNVYEADAYASDLGYGYGLAEAIDETTGDMPNEGILRVLQRTYPSANDRINRLIRRGVPYRAY